MVWHTQSQYERIFGPADEINMVVFFSLAIIWFSFRGLHFTQAVFILVHKSTSIGYNMEEPLRHEALDCFGTLFIAIFAVYFWKSNLFFEQKL